MALAGRAKGGEVELIERKNDPTLIPSSLDVHKIVDGACGEGIGDEMELINPKNDSTLIPISIDVKKNVDGACGEGIGVRWS